MNVGDLFKKVFEFTTINRKLRELQADQLGILIEEMQTLQHDIGIVARMEDSLGEIMGLFCSIGDEASPEEAKPLLDRVVALVGQYTRGSDQLGALMKGRLQPSKNASRKEKRGWGSKKLKE